MHPFLRHEGVIAFAHRGGAGEAPENTLEAFARAAELGYTYFETDAHLTRDGVLVAFHDPRLDRVTDRAGAIAELTAAEVEAADAGYRFSPDGRTFPFRGRGVRVPRLEELLTRWPQARVNIDPKSDACVRPLAALLDRLDAWDRVCIGSFSDRRLREIRALGRGRACTSMGPRAVAVVCAAAATGGVVPRQGADCLQVPPRWRRVPIVTARMVSAARRAGLRVYVWTINDERAMRELLALGVDGLMTDRLALLRDVLR
jgi:glycerophosphoryl diester phosphodiesterase